jgi:hypothetical protein
MKRTQRKYYSWLFSLIAVSLAFITTIVFPASLAGFTTFVSSIGGLLTILHASNVAQKKLTGKDDSIEEK